MTDRRDVLAALAAGVAAIPVAAMGQETLPTAKQTKTKPEVEEQCDCCASEHGGGEVPSSPDYFPNVPVETHTGQRALFYNDLLRGKLVLVNFMSIKNDEHYPVTENLSHVPKLLGERLGKDVFMYSITVDPEHDTPRKLQRFVEERGVAAPGWLFLTGQEKPLELIKGRFFVSRGGHQHHEPGQPGHDCSMGLVRYGNVDAGVWGSVAAKADPAQIAERIEWISLRPAAKGAPRRRGPATILRSPHAPLTKNS